ncbi:MAG: TMEM165/GDT1 family protein [Nitrospinae bacterium]|nr:TMEM165/GDT1 family protein [Nitrospinota bacterium]MDA1110854.1 TMEM165/GDT1 family protein [Nitrospinota bacterium]
MKAYWIVFFSVFLAELGDKTQLATLLFATNQSLGKVGVFFASSLALVVSTLIAVVVGGQISHLLSVEKLKLIAGAGFILIGAWTLWDAR